MTICSESQIGIHVLMVHFSLTLAENFLQIHEQQNLLSYSKIFILLLFTIIFLVRVIEEEACIFSKTPCITITCAYILLCPIRLLASLKQIVLSSKQSCFHMDAFEYADFNV